MKVKVIINNNRIDSNTARCVSMTYANVSAIYPIYEANVISALLIEQENKRTVVNKFQHFIIVDE